MTACRDESGSCCIELLESSPDGMRSCLQCFGDMFAKLVPLDINPASALHATKQRTGPPDCDMFIFVSSNIRATINPSRWSRHLWYLRLPTLTAACCHLLWSGVQHSVI